MPQIDFGKPDGAIGVEIVLHYGARCFQGFSDALYDIQDPPAKHTNPARNFHRITEAGSTLSDTAKDSILQKFLLPNSVCKAAAYRYPCT